MKLNARFYTRILTFAAALGGVALGAPAHNGGGDVLPASAKVSKYSLADAAEATAAYNAGGPTLPDVPFAIVTGGDFTVSPNESIYVPVFFADDSGTPDPAPFPKNVQPQKQAADYLLEAANNFAHEHGFPADLEISSFVIEVDGQVVDLGDAYTVGVTTAPLPDAPPGGPAGTHYIVAAAFLSPLAPGEHTIGVGGLVNGQAVIFNSSDVTVK